MTVAEACSVSGLPLAAFQSNTNYFITVLVESIYRNIFLNSVLISLMNTVIICYREI